MANPYSNLVKGTPGIQTPQPLPPIGNPTNLSFPPVSQQMVDPKTGVMTIIWQQWFQQAYVRIGGSTPVNPAVLSQTLGDDYPYNNLTNSSAVVQYLNTVPFSPGALFYFYISQLGQTTLIDSLTCQNNASLPASIDVFFAPVNTLPPITTPINIPANSGVISLTQFTGFQMGSASYMGILVNPASAPPLAQGQVHFILKGRTIS
jgi:hypothetical protein